MESFKNIELCYPKSPLPIIQKKRFIKYKINIKKIWKNPKKITKKLDFSSFDSVIQTSKTDKRNSKKGGCGSSNTFVQTAGNEEKAQMSYIGRGLSPLPGQWGWALGSARGALVGRSMGRSSGALRALLGRFGLSSWNYAGILCLASPELVA